MTRQIGEKINLLALTKEELQAEVVRMGEPKFRAKQLWDWIHVKGVVCFPTREKWMTERWRLTASSCILCLKVVLSRCCVAQDDFESMENLPKSLRTRLVEEATLGTLSIAVEQVSPCSAGNPQPRALQCIVSAAPFSTAASRR